MLITVVRKSSAARKNGKRVVTVAATRPVQATPGRWYHVRRYGIAPCPYHGRDFRLGEEAPGQGKGRTGKIRGRKIAEGWKCNFHPSAYCLINSKRLSFVEVVAQCAVKLFLDGLAPFPVSFQHSGKLFLGAFVIFKGAGSFAAHRVYNASILVFAGELVKAVFVGKPLNSDSQHIFVLLVFF